MKRALFLRTESSCRSQAAGGRAAWLLGGRVEMACAGSEPTAVEVLAQVGIDRFARRSSAVGKRKGRAAHHVGVATLSEERSGHG